MNSNQDVSNGYQRIYRTIEGASTDMATGPIFGISQFLKILKILVQFFKKFICIKFSKSIAQLNYYIYLCMSERDKGNIY